MKFPYKRFSSGVLRPIIPISVRNPSTRTSIRYLALVDSGADLCIFAAEIGQLIDIDITAGKESSISGVLAGQSRSYYMHDVEIEVGGRWQKASVGFMSALSTNGHGLVGRLGFFDRFSFVKFEQPKSTVELGAAL